MSLKNAWAYTVRLYLLKPTSQAGPQIQRVPGSYRHSFSQICSCASVLRHRCQAFRASTERQYKAQQCVRFFFLPVPRFESRQRMAFNSCLLHPTEHWDLGNASLRLVHAVLEVKLNFDVCAC